MSQINVIFFDLGSVLVYVHRDKLLHQLAYYSHQNEEQIRERMTAKRQVYADFERGRIDAREFYTMVSPDFNHQLDYELFKKLYVEMFSLNQEAADVAQKLATRFRLSIISNTDELHFNYIMQQYTVMKLFKEPTTSFETHSVKPEKEIYLRALEKMNVAAGESLFIDDLQENIAGARAVGMNAVHYTERTDMRNELAHFAIHI